jgi:hypothetical protein
VALVNEQFVEASLHCGYSLLRVHAARRADSG